MNQELRPDQLFRRCDPECLSFQTTADLPELTEIVGQPRAVEAIQFGIGIEREGYNIFAAGPARTGKASLVRHDLEQRAREKPVPADWCYVNNFAEPHRPAALSLPAGRGEPFQRDVARLVETVRTALAAAFEGEEYQQRKQAITQSFKQNAEQALEALRARAVVEGLDLMQTPAGFIFVPLQHGKPMSPEIFQQLPTEEQAPLGAKLEHFQKELETVFHQMPRWARERQEQLQALSREIAGHAIEPLFAELRERYVDLPEIVSYLEAARHNILENLETILQAAGAEEESVTRSLPGLAAMRQYQVNLLVDHSASQGSPVIYEDNPSYQNLLGRVEHVSVMGALVTDFTLLKAGALHRANGGYLILDAERVLQQPFAWDALKRALQSRQVRIESPGQLLSLASTVSLEPEPIPLDVKVVLLGELRLYYLLCALDPDFRELFKVQADFDDRMTRDPASESLYASLVGTLARRHEIRALDRAAVARVIEQSARLVGDAERLSAQMGEIMDLLYEADYWATRQGHEVITCADVQQAIESQRYRSDRLRESLMEETGRGMLVVETTGAAVGRVNGLSVIQLGAFAFGRPSVISARVRLGKGEVVDIEREVELGGPLHSKGVLILTGYLGTRYAAERPLSLAASVVFEQSYGGVEGDSASLAELCALLSAIAGAPLKQSLAVTGSVNQHGQAQAIGGVNEKVEGFFDLCQARGLTGEQGVIIPATNARQLMLRQEVVDAVAAGRFHLYAVETADQALECLTGLPAGERDTSGRFPVGSFNAQVEARLAYLTDRWLEFTAEADGSRKRSLVGLS